MTKHKQIPESELKFLFYRHDRIGAFDKTSQTFVAKPKNINMPSRRHDSKRIRGPIGTLTHCVIQTQDNKFYHGVAARSASDQLNRSKARGISYQRATSLIWEITDQVPKEFDKTNLKMMHAICDQKYQEIVNFDAPAKTSEVTAS